MCWSPHHPQSPALAVIEFAADGPLPYAGPMHANLTSLALPATPPALDFLAGLLDFFACRLAGRHEMASVVVGVGVVSHYVSI